MISVLLFLFLNLPDTWKEWRYARPITVPSAGLATFVCPRTVYDRAGTSLADLRIVDPAGEEVPFAIQKRPERKPPQWRTAKFRNNSDANGAMEVIVDIGDQNIHNTLKLDLPGADFLISVDISGGDSEKGPWHPLRTGMPIYRYRPDGLDGNQAISYPQSYSRYLNLKLTPQATANTAKDAAPRPTQGPLTVERCQVGFEEILRQDWDVYTPVFFSERPKTTLQTWWRADAISKTMPVSGMRFVAMNEEFHRALRISTSDDGKNWIPFQDGDIFKAAGERGSERLELEFPETRARFWRVAFFDNGFPPLTISRIELLGVPYHVVFQGRANTEYRALYGNGKAKEVRYEIGAQLQPGAYKTAAMATIGEEEPVVTHRRGWKFWLPIVGGILALFVIVTIVVVVAGG